MGNTQSVAWNRRWWNERYHWDDQGEQWSEPWGSAERQWFGTLLPFLPTGNGLEIAPGFGRWTEYLLPKCERLTAVDLTPKCVDACQHRFADQTNFRCLLNDGRSLEMVSDESIDFALSFDSLVHAEADVLDDYLRQLRRKLTRDGVGFIHHSNLGEYASRFWYRKIPVVRSVLKRVQRREEPATHGRTFSVTAEKFARMAARHGLRCLSQEVINWKSPLLTDCISVFVRDDSARQGPNVVRRNDQFMDEAESVRGAPGILDVAVASETVVASAGGWFRYGRAA